MTNCKQPVGDDLKPGGKEQKEKEKSIGLPKSREEKQDKGKPEYSWSHT